MNTGQIIKAKGSNQFTQIANSVIQNPNISMQAKGLFCYLQSLPADWVINKSDLPNHFTNGYDGIITAFNELEALELIISVEIRDTAGKFKGFNYICYPVPIRELTDQPIREKPISGKPISGFPISGNPDLQRNSNTKKHSTNKIQEKETSADLVFPFLDQEFLDKWEQWKSYKKSQFRFTFKSTLSQQAALKQLEEFAGGRLELAIKIIDQSIANGWHGLFALKNQKLTKDESQKRNNTRFEELFGKQRPNGFNGTEKQN